MALTDTEERRLLDLSLDGTFLALFTASPGEGGSLASELTLGGYVRMAAAFNLAATVGGATSKALSADISLPMASAAYDGPVTHFGFVSAASGGTLRWYSPLNVTRTVAMNDTYVQEAAQTIATLN